MKKNILKWILITVVLVWTLVPLVWFLKTAFQTPAEISSFPPRFYPHHPTPLGLITVLGFRYTASNGQTFSPSGQAAQIVRGFLNSFVVAVSVTVITLFVVVPLAYVFGRLQFPHKNKLLFAVLLSVAVPPISTLIPFYIMFVRLELSGTLIGLILVTLTVTIPFVAWMMIGFFKNLPRIEPLARIDGFSRTEAFIRVVVPMAKVGIGVGSVISFLFAWNEYTFAWIMTNGTPAATISPAISGFLFMHPEPEHLAAALLYSLIPPFLVAYVLQRYISQMNVVESIGS